MRAWCRPMLSVRSASVDQPGSGRPSVAVVSARPSSPIDCCQSASCPSRPRTSSSTAAAGPAPKARASAAASAGRLRPGPRGPHATERRARARLPPFPLVLTGDYADQAHQLLERASQDLDVATGSAPPMEEIAQILREGLRGPGGRHVADVEIAPLSARFQVTDPLRRRRRGRRPQESVTGRWPQDPPAPDAAYGRSWAASASATFLSDSPARAGSALVTGHPWETTSAKSPLPATATRAAATVPRPGVTLVWPIPGLSLDLRNPDPARHHRGRAAHRRRPRRPGRRPDEGVVGDGPRPVRRLHRGVRRRHRYGARCPSSPRKGGGSASRTTPTPQPP